MPLACSLRIAGLGGGSIAGRARPGHARAIRPAGRWPVPRVSNPAGEVGSAEIIVVIVRGVA
jgi:hypothetical protein